jgi:hypothetical protein
LRQSTNGLTPPTTPNRYFNATDDDGDGMEVGSDEWNALNTLLQKNMISLDAKAAGDDGVLDANEFIVYIDKTLEQHFTTLKKALMDVHDLEMQLLVGGGDMV